MRDVAFAFFLAAVLCVTVGMGLGLWMGPTGNFQFTPVHAHLNLAGWATMALFAIYYRLTPQAARGWLPRVHASTAILGIILMASGLATEIAGLGGEAVLIGGSLLTAASMLIFLYTLLRHGFGAPADSRRMSPGVMPMPAE